jgi:segregation and condensation protein A
MQQKIFEIILEENEISWQKILYDLVKVEDMNPWDIDISTITQKYIETLKSLKKHDFRVSGKVILAAAILLKIKSNRFMDEDMLELDKIIYESENEPEDEMFFDEYQDDFHTPGNVSELEKQSLIPRTPQPRIRKVSIYDLMQALDQALEVRRRRIIKSLPEENTTLMPEVKKVDLTSKIKKTFFSIRQYYSQNTNPLVFSKLLLSEEKDDKIHTFIPLLHLSNLRKINLEQFEHLGDINITINKSTLEKELVQELSTAQQ